MSIIFKLGYGRKSTESDERQIQSIESQLTWMKGVLGEEFNSITIFTESKSAKDPYKREEFQKLISEIEKINKKYKGKGNFEIWIYAWGLDRLSRNPVDSGLLQYFLQIGKLHQIVCCDRVFTRVDSGIMMGLFNALNNQFIIDLQKNTKRGMKDKADKGGCIQSTPNGYINNKITKEAEVDKKLKPIVKKIFELRDKLYSLRAIVNFCKEKGYKTKRGTDFSKTTIENILKNPFYIGFQKNEGTLKKANHKVFIDINIWNRVNSLKRKGYARKNINLFPLKGLVKSWNTKKTLIAFQKKGKYIYYSTHNSYKVADNVKISQKNILDYFDEIIHLYNVSSELRPIISEIIKKEFIKKFEKIQEEKDSINIHLRELKKKQTRLFELVCNGTISEEKYKEEENNFSIQKQKYILDLESLDDLDRGIMQETLYFVELLENLSDKRKTWDDNKKLGFIKILVVELFVDEKKELFIQENKLFEFIKMCNMSLFSNFGT